MNGYRLIQSDSEGWFEWIEEIPHDNHILVFVPYINHWFDPATPTPRHEYSIAWWREDLNRWDGEWRYFSNPALSSATPTHWKPLDVPAAVLLDREMRTFIAETAGIPMTVPAMEEVQNTINAYDHIASTPSPKGCIYLDIDGVLLTKHLEPAPNAVIFLERALEKYPDTTYWLTTRCQGDTQPVIRALKSKFDARTMDLIARVKPTTWDISRTEVIDFKKPFLWFDDTMLTGDLELLKSRNVLENWIRVDLQSDPARLARFAESFPLPVVVTEKPLAA